MLTSPEIAYSLHRAETNGPDADSQSTDDSGVTWLRYAVDFKFNDRTVTTHIWARDMEDAELRLAALRGTGHIVGQVYSERSV